MRSGDKVGSSASIGVVFLFFHTFNSLLRKAFEGHAGVQKLLGNRCPGSQRRHQGPRISRNGCVGFVRVPCFAHLKGTQKIQHNILRSIIQIKDAPKRAVSQHGGKICESACSNPVDAGKPPFLGSPHFEAHLYLQRS